MEGEEEEEKRSDTPERKDKDDLEEKDGRKDTKQKEELDPEEKEQDTAEVRGAHANLDLDKVDSTEEKNSETSIKSGEVPRVNGESEDAGSDVSLLSPKRHLERQVKTSSCLLKVYSSFFCLFFILTASCHPHFLVSWKMLNLAESPA